MKNPTIEEFLKAVKIAENLFEKQKNAQNVLLLEHVETTPKETMNNENYYAGFNNGVRCCNVKVEDIGVIDFIEAFFEDV